MNKSLLMVMIVLLLSACAAPEEIHQFFTIKGKITYDGNVVNINDFTVLLMSNQTVIASSNEEEFSFTGLEAGKDYTVVPQSTDYSHNGITTLDWIRVEKYINQEIRLNSLQRLAADMNKDNIIDETDRFIMRNCIVGTGPCPSWRFASADYDGHGTGYVDQYVASNLSSDIEVNFVPVKIGDVNYTIHF
ncbi:MAG: hypothetical protein IPP15_03985 [Saprospiraceae bacterium]|uniref:Lipoprotein n=1 Tax=Candidatus Opimibacter skivensis TaxID=2982028 RepID=A0A9D7ST82_9BACT|nr:hypothetical protein [Candidatus Opimibacter skivensis]